MMRFIILFGLAFCVPTEGHTIPQARIVGGSHIEISEAPHAVFIWFYDEKTKVTQYCGGSIIAEAVVVTAGHCVIKHLDPKIHSVRAGSKFQKSGGQNTKISKIVLHENFTQASPLTADFDIALLFLKTPFEFNKDVAPVSIPDQDMQVPDGAMVFVAGWGLTGYSSGGDPIRADSLNRINIPIVDQLTCSRIYPGINKNHICAGDLKSKTTCKGDSGSGLIWNNVLIGIVSVGKHGCSPTMAAVYTRVATFSSWVHEHIQHQNLHDEETHSKHGQNVRKPQVH